MIIPVSRWFRSQEEAAIYGAWQRLHCALKAIARPWDADFLNEKMEGKTTATG